MPRHRSGKADPETALRLKAAREAKDLTQEQAARALGVCLETYQNWESGFSEPRASQLQILARLLGATPDRLLGFQPHV